MEFQQMAGHLIRRLHQRSTQVFQQRMQAAGFDLTSVQFAALEALRNHPGVDQAGLATLISYDRATIGGVVDRLEQKGCVRRVVSAQDRRARQVYLTDVGQKVVKEALPVVRELQREILADLDEKDRDRFLQLARVVLKLA